MANYFLDTYVMVEIANGNPLYSNFSEFECRTTVFNLLELAYYLVKTSSDTSLLDVFNKTQLFVQEDWILDVAKFKKNHDSRNFSYADCIGYIAGLKSGFHFVTGDIQFKGMPNVEFVK